MLSQMQNESGRRRVRMTLAGAFCVALGLTAAPAHAERFVVVNGQRMNLAQIAYLEQMHCGPIADGAYWYNESNRVWGYAGNPYPQGVLGDNCYRQPSRRPSLSERGMLFSPHDWVR